MVFRGIGAVAVDCHLRLRGIGDETVDSFYCIRGIVVLSVDRRPWNRHTQFIRRESRRITTTNNYIYIRLTNHILLALTSRHNPCLIEVRPTVEHLSPIRLSIWSIRSLLILVAPVLLIKTCDRSGLRHYLWPASIVVGRWLIWLLVGQWGRLAGVTFSQASSNRQ